jgi:hypothetical protein
VPISNEAQPLVQWRDRWWMVTHEHVSVPFDMKSGQALMDLKP